VVKGRFQDVARRLALTLRRRRKRLGLSQEDVAYAAELSTRYYQLMEAGRANPTLKALWEVANVLQRPLESLIRDALR
jgi:transcriptional regulator with XRE-family HTH domain